jgi:ornithine carbamoyltransferase
MEVRVGSPEGFLPNAEILARSSEMARRGGVEIRITQDPIEAVRDADVVYTDTWASMGQESEHAARVQALRAYQVNAELLGHAADDVLFMHCLPAHRGEEVTDAVMDGSHSVVFDQAENRLHVQKAILALLMEP